jgi:hypothetical protein
MNGSIRFSLASLGAAALAMLAASAAQAQDGRKAEEDFDRTPKDCLSTSRIRRTDILDDRTILFYMRGNREVYRNYLPRDCPGLERNDRFAYRTTNAQICNVDTISVLEQFGLDLRTSFVCRLGDFIPITVEEAENLKLEDEHLGRRSAIKSEQVELPPEAENDKASASEPSDANGGAADEPAPAAGEQQPAEKGERRRRRDR